MECEIIKAEAAADNNMPPKINKIVFVFIVNILYIMDKFKH